MTEESREEKSGREPVEQKEPATSQQDSPRPGSGQAGQAARTPEPASVDAAAAGTGGEAPPDTPPHPYEKLLDEYPLRDAAEDPVWSVRIVKGWMWFLAFCFAGILLLLALGFFYD